MQNFTLWLLPLFPALLFVGAAACRSRDGRSAGVVSGWIAGVAAVAAGGCVLLVVCGMGGTWRFAPWGADAIAAVALRLDAISAVMALLVAVLGLVVIRFSVWYLDGDGGQSRFFFWLNSTLACVLVLVWAGNVQVLLLAWVATSLCLHHLLVYYPHRVPALFAARKKFVISRMGDVCMLVAAAVLFQAQGTLDFESLFDAAALGQTAGMATAGALFAACAMFKSAQVPFHGWLPDTMETPTPVSAIMHAGIINAGGFLIIRTSPIMVHAPGALIFLAILGGLTAAFGALVMLTQPSVKRALAFSTIAQMGFMLLQCGLGAFGLALLHILAHSLYKAHAFLHAGSTIGSPARAAVPLRTSHLGMGLVGGLAVASVGWLLFRAAGAPTPGVPVVFFLVLALALAYGIARTAAIPLAGGGGIAAALTAALGIGVVALTLHKLALWVFADLPVAASPAWVSVVVAAVFVGLFGIQSMIWRANRSPLGRALYVHALHGFYLGTLGNRLLNRLWPPHPAGAHVLRSFSNNANNANNPIAREELLT